jgi:hypothetical protein
VTQVDLNSLAFWFPRIEAAGLKVPRTEIVETSIDLMDLLDGQTPARWAGFMFDLEAAGDRIGWPAFLRTGHGSGKHEWNRTCFVGSRAVLSQHVSALVEWSACVDMWGLPTNVWAIRELIATAPLFVCSGFGGFPVTREFRFFVRGDKVEHAQPYWPPDAVEEGYPTDPEWRDKLAAASKATPVEYGALCCTALAAVEAVGGGHWSVDMLEDAGGDWWLTDMAEGDRSFRWEP